ncbi:MAG TPA: hypothetical protein VN851_11875 [Thermoanaerobaculia bacterium]|nr:hypothetical protein [Thermoanaerobaculia bacterium]
MDKVVTVPDSEPGLPVSGKDIEIGASKPAVSQPNEAVKKVIVAVHGIGDQYSFATIQSVVNQFCLYYGQPAAVPLGNFHSGQPAYSLSAPYPPDPFKRFAFTEVYWAPISRGLVDEKHTLEEAKTWARTIVERLRLRWHEEEKKKGWQGDTKTCRDEDFHLTQQVLGEIIQTIAVVERLCFLAEKAGIFTFDLKKLLDDYLGDVQVVAEFKDQRDKILATFAKLLEDVEVAFPKAEIYIVAHSEGTVVALLGLLKAFRDTDQPRWTRKMRGLMTMGSPIDKHLALWPELFGDSAPSKAPTQKIEWRNYYDFGDPVGFELDSIREWITANNWQSVFHFEGGKHDFGFARYPFPGKAHVDYWKDRAVFEHFISEVVVANENGTAGGAEASAELHRVKRREPKAAPSSLGRTWWISYVAPYAGVLALLLIASYGLYKAVTGAMGSESPTSLILQRSAGLAALLYGVTVVARIPRLTYSESWRMFSCALAVLGALLYRWSLNGAEESLIKNLSIPPGFFTLSLALLVIVLTFLMSVKRPSWGLVPLMIIGTFAATVVIVFRIEQQGGPRGPVWPIVLAIVAFLYLWWLAALLFDLVFIWHLYIRHSKLNSRINQVLGTYKERIGASRHRTAQAPVSPGRISYTATTRGRRGRSR